MRRHINDIGHWASRDTGTIVPIRCARQRAWPVPSAAGRAIRLGVHEVIAHFPVCPLPPRPLPSFSPAPSPAQQPSPDLRRRHSCCTTTVCLRRCGHLDRQQAVLEDFPSFALKRSHPSDLDAEMLVDAAGGLHRGSSCASTCSVIAKSGRPIRSSFERAGSASLPASLRLSGCRATDLSRNATSTPSLRRPRPPSLRGHAGLEGFPPAHPALGATHGRQRLLYRANRGRARN